MNNKALTQLSRYLSLILRHKPETVGMTLDQNGWAEVEHLMTAINRSGQYSIDIETLKKIVETDEKQRYAMSHDQKKIRASQGHSIDVDLQLTPVEPPEFLYHGTTNLFVVKIQQEGLKPLKRNFVHLSCDIETARQVGSRRGTPVILKIASKKLYDNGQPFYLSENQVWLTYYIKPEYLQIMSSCDSLSTEGMQHLNETQPKIS